MPPASGAATDAPKRLSCAGLFAGIGGFERGLALAGHHTAFLCDADPAAVRVLKRQFKRVAIATDVRALATLPEVDVVTAGFPCQDLSQVGRRRGIDGPNSSLISVVLELLRNAPESSPRWLVLENVPFMLTLDRGRAMTSIVSALESMGWRWAYRTIDARAFGLPQRRRRVILFASREHDPRGALLAQEKGASVHHTRGNHACGFYWTEGNRGLGWAIDAVPPLKGGSGLHIPSPPAIWFPRRRFIGVPSIEDAERLQGFPAGWTSAAHDEEHGSRRRWRLVGNAVSVPLARWIGERLVAKDQFRLEGERLPADGFAWPAAAWGDGGGVRYSAPVSEWPVRAPYIHLAQFLEHPVLPLSRKATEGFLGRLRKSGLTRPEQFETDLESHAQTQAVSAVRRPDRAGRKQAHVGHAKRQSR
jgi:DNA (cytosine-5)-methyltransferase 1